MNKTVNYFFALLFCFSFLSASAQHYDSTLKALRHRSDIAMNKHNLPLYLKLANEEFAFTSAQNDTISMIRACVKLVDYFTFTQRNLDSIKYYRIKGLYWAKLKNNKEYEADFNFMQAGQYVDDGKYVEAYALYKSLEAIMDANKFQFKPLYNNGYSGLLMYLKEYKKGLERAKLAAEGYEQQQDTQSVSVVYCNIAGTYMEINQIDSAFAYMYKALKVNQEIKDTFAMAECYTRIGFLYSKKGKKDEALHYYKTAFELSHDNPTGFLMSNYTDVLMSEGRFKEAEGILLDLKRSPDVRAQLNAIRSLIDLKKKEGKFKEALEYSEEYNEKDQELLNVDKIKQIEELQTQYDVASKENEITLLQERNVHQGKILARNRIILYVGIGLFSMILLVVFLIFRNRAIRLRVEQILLEQQLLRSQMNPHFIFNSLTTIQSTILQKEHIKAASYIATFSKLVRNILENSTLSKVTFSSEIAALGDYLVLQKIRFQERLNYEIKIDENIEQDMIFIPPMLFQPIVENAIEHGISKKKDGWIYIHFQQFEKYIQCTVTDNGIGYGNNTESMKKNASKTSLSTQITKRRLAILSRHIKHNLSYNIVVLHNNELEVTGTKVTIDIPILS